MLLIWAPAKAAPAHTAASLARAPPSANPVATILAGVAPPVTFRTTCVNSLLTTLR